MTNEPTVTKSERLVRAEGIAREMLARGETPTVRAVHAICGGDYTAVHRVVADIKRQHQAALARDLLGGEPVDDFGDLPELAQRVAASNLSPAVQRLGLQVMASTRKIATEAIAHGIAAVRSEMDVLLRAEEIDLQSVQQQIAREQADHAETVSLVSGLYEAREAEKAERDALAVRVTEAEALLAERDDRIAKL